MIINMYEICIRVNGTYTIGRPLRLPISFYMEYEKGRYTTPTKLRGLITLILIYYAASATGASTREATKARAHAIGCTFHLFCLIIH